MRVCVLSMYTCIIIFDRGTIDFFFVKKSLSEMGGKENRISFPQFQWIEARDVMTI